MNQSSGCPVSETQTTCFRQSAQVIGARVSFTLASMTSIVPLPGQVDERNPTPCPLPATLSPPSASRLTAEGASGSTAVHTPEPPEVLLHRAAQSKNLFELNRVLSKPRLNVNAVEVRRFCNPRAPVIGIPNPDSTGDLTSPPRRDIMCSPAAARRCIWRHSTVGSRARRRCCRREREPTSQTRCVASLCDTARHPLLQPPTHEVLRVAARYPHPPT